MPMIEAHDLRKTYRANGEDVHALDGLSLQVPEGRVIGLLGPNGAGKTTAVKVLTTLIRPDSGTARVAGLDVLTQAREVKRVVGSSGQYAAVDENLTGVENLEMVGRLYHLGIRAARARARELIDLFDLAGTVPAGKFQTAAFYLLFYGLAVRTPLFPLHGWLPNMAQHGLIAVGPALMVGVKVGIYGMLRFVLPLTPDAVEYWQPYVVGFAMAGVFFTAALAFQQSNLRRLLAFAVVSHTSLLIIGLFSLHESGIQGAVLLAANFGLAVTGMWFIVGFVFRRTGTTELHELSGLFERIPFLAIAFLIFGLAIVGMPGTPGFDAAHLVLEASIDKFGALSTVATALGNVAAAGFLLWAFQKAFLSQAKAGGHDVDKTLIMEYLVCGVALTALLAIGFFTEPWLYLTETASQAAAARFAR